ncbi:MAG: hypothetical protein ABR962_11810 [Candidatus Bathyarchaeia archaeon]
MNSQNTRQWQYVAILGLVLVFLGLLLAIYYAFALNNEIDIYRERDLGFIIVGVSIQLLGIGLIAIGKK